MTPTPAQLRAARAYLDISAKQLGDMAGLSFASVIKAEAGKPVQRATLGMLKTTLERMGVTFDDEGGIKMIPVEEQKKD